MYNLIWMDYIIHIHKYKEHDALYLQLSKTFYMRNIIQLDDCYINKINR